MYLKIAIILNKYEINIVIFGRVQQDCRDKYLTACKAMRDLHIN